MLASTHDSGEKILRHFARMMRLSRQHLVTFLYSRDGRATNGGAAARTVPAIALLARIAQGGRDEQRENDDRRRQQRRQLRLCNGTSS